MNPTENNQRSPMAQRLSSRLVIDPSGCWLWIKGILRDGYGYLQDDNGRRIVAHRAMWTVTHGGIPNGLCVLHKCDVRNCINPDHLFLGTYKDNSRDMCEKGRQKHGERHWCAKLNETQARTILGDTRTYHEIAAQYGLTAAAISRLKRGVNWKHLHTSSQ